MDHQPRTVLVVDDDVELASMVELLLEEIGYRAVSARDGKEALEKVAEEMPAAILLDMRMPGMNGWEFARQFGARYDHRAPIIVLTAGEDARKDAQEIDADDYLGKPFEFDDLVNVLARHAPLGT